MLKSAKTTKDILEIQENIRELEDEIDVSEGRLRFIDDRVNYSTLNLSLYKEKVRTSTTSKIGFGSRFRFGHGRLEQFCGFSFRSYFALAFLSADSCVYFFGENGETGRKIKIFFYFALNK
jgi:hypothetical protein